MSDFRPRTVLRREAAERSLVVAGLASALLAGAAGAAEARCDMLDAVAALERESARALVGRAGVDGGAWLLDVLENRLEARRRAGVVSESGAAALSEYIAAKRAFLAAYDEGGAPEARALDLSEGLDSLRRLVASDAFDWLCGDAVAAALPPPGAEGGAPDLADRLSRAAAALGDERDASLFAAFALAGLATPFAARAAFRRRRRRDPRYLVCLDVELTTRAGVLSTQIVDISKDGARVVTKDQVEEGDRIEIAAPGVTRAGSVVWTTPGFGGALFDESLSRKELKSILDRARLTALDGVKTRL